MSFRWPTASLRTYLVVMILIASVPIGLLMSVQIVREARDQTERLRLSLETAASALAQRADRELQAHVDGLRMLAPARLDDLDAAREFARRLAREARQRPDWEAVVLTTADGRWVTFDGVGETVSPGVLARTAPPRPPSDAASEPHLTGLLPVPGEQAQRAVAISVPIDGRGGFRLAAWIEQARWRSLLAMAGQPPGGLATLYDAEHRVVARSTVRPGGLEGPPPEVLARSLDAAVDATTAPATGPDAVLSGWHPLELGGWGIGIGVPAAPLESAHLRAMLTAFGTVAACLVIGVSLALWVARRVVGPLQAIGRHAPMQRGHIAIEEIAALRDALAEAGEREAAVRDRLQAKADEFEAVFEGTPIGLVVLPSRSDRRPMFNAALQALLAPRPDGSVPRLARAGRVLEEIELPWRTAADIGRPVPPVELDLLDGDAPPRQVVAQAVPLLDADGEPRGAIAVVADITDRKRVQRQVADADRQLRETQKLVELAQAAGRVGFFRYRVGADELHAMPGHAELFGTPADAPPESLEDWLRRVHDDDRDRARECLQALREGRTTSGRVSFRLGDGPRAQRWMSARLVIGPELADGEGQVLGVVVDITEQKAAEDERAARMVVERAARQEAEAANQAKDEFLAMLGHELRNPLNAIASAVQVLKHGGDRDGARADDARAIIDRQTRHLAHMMDDLLDMARVASGKVLLERRPLELGRLVAAVVGTMRVTGDERAHRLSVTVEEVWVDADATRLEQVATNLIANALKYTPPGGAIDVQVAAHGDQAVLEVRDDGVGIAPGLLAQVFEPFVQGPRPLDRRAGGLGIGLSLVRRLVQLHGGTVDADSEGQGSRFRVTLPRVAAPLPSAPARERGARRPRSILLVEDNEDALQALRTALELDGHQVDTAIDGRAGLDALLARRPEVAVIDIGLPQINGYELARRGRGAGYAGRLIALSGYGLDDNVRESLRAGFDEHLSKPVDFERLRELLETA